MTEYSFLETFVGHVRLEDLPTVQLAKVHYQPPFARRSTVTVDRSTQRKRKSLPDVILNGDFNLPDIDWVTLSITITIPPVWHEKRSESIRCVYRQQPELDEPFNFQIREHSRAVPHNQSSLSNRHADSDRNK